MSNLHSDPSLADRFTNEYGAFGNLFKEAALVKRGLSAQGLKTIGTSCAGCTKKALIE